MGARQKLGTLLAALPLSALAVGGCDWRDFGKIQDHTPVLAVGAPSQFGADDFGNAVLPISTLPTGAKGARYIVSGAGAGALAIVDLDAAGHATSQNVSSQNLFADQPITALAEVGGTNQVLLGAPGGIGSTGAVSILTMGETPDVALFDAPGVGNRFGLGVAAGQLVGTAAPDFVVASAADLTVYVDGDPTKGVASAAPPDSCPMTVPTGLPQRDQVQRAVLVAGLTGAAGAQQIVVGTPSVTDEGAVNVFTVDATGVATCAMTFRNADHRFGHALATGDFDGDGVLDLLIGSPPSHAFWIKGPLSAASPVLSVALAPGVSELGATVAAANLDGQGGDEALIGNPDATVGNNLLAGEVRIVTGPALDTELPPLRRHDPEGADFFGIDVAALPFFCDGGCGAAKTPFQTLALVGSGKHAFTYFKLGAGSTDRLMDPPMDPRTP